MIHDRSANVVLIPSQQVDPSAFNQVWLLDNGIVRREDFSSGSTFLPVLSNVVTPGYDLLIMQNRIQFSIKTALPEGLLLLQDVFLRFLEAAALAVSSVGVNFNFIIAAPEGRDLLVETKRVFLHGNNLFSGLLENARTGVGVFMTQPMEGGNFQLDIKPGRPANPAPGTPTDVLVCAYNYHFEVASRDLVARVLQSASSKAGDAEALTVRIDAALFS